MRFNTLRSALCALRYFVTIAGSYNDRNVMHEEPLWKIAAPLMSKKSTLK
jgi:hypothetical protein